MTTPRMIERVIVHRNTFHDPVTLMEASEQARSREDVTHVAVGMADSLNLYIFRGRHGYNVDGSTDVGPNDLVIAVRALSEGAADAAIAAIERHLAEHRGGREVAAIGSYEYVADSTGEGTIERIEWRSAPARNGAALARLAARAGRIA
ncbi:MAG TPA: hypothetical protein VE736_13520, partial [Gaiellaceae bacterium]|nr:hypothetical protein [Gaiellaceae bacterium]